MTDEQLIEEFLEQYQMRLKYSTRYDSLSKLIRKYYIRAKNNNFEKEYLMDGLETLYFMIMAHKAEEER